MRAHKERAHEFFVKYLINFVRVLIDIMTMFNIVNMFNIMNMYCFFRKIVKTIKSEAAIKNVKRQKLTYLTEKKLKALANALIEIELKDIEGMIIEAGCALGGSSILISSIKNKNRLFNIYDVFEMIPPPSDKDDDDVHERYKIILSGESKGIDGDNYYGYMINLYHKVINNFEVNGIELEKNNIFLVKGLVQDTLYPNSLIALAHIDVDWYEPVMTCLVRIEPQLSVGGYLVLDDYQDWSGCRKAVDDFFADKKDRFEFNTSPGSLVVKKIK